jgi:hypothetical protein
MKSKLFKKLSIGIDESSQTQFRSNLRLKQRYINELYDYISNFVKIEDKSSLQGNFYNDFVELFLAKYQSEFPPISINKMLEAMEVNVLQIDELTKNINSIDIKLDKDLKAKEPDFNIYTETEEQNKLFRTLEKICKELASLHTQGIRLTPQSLVQGTQQALLYDWTKQQMMPNTRKILGDERVF